MNIKQYMKDYYQENKEKWKEYGKQYRQDPKNKERIKEYQRQHYRNNIIEIKKQNKLRRKNNPHRAWAVSARAGHRNCGYKIDFTTEELEEKIKKTSHCPLCGIKLVWQYPVGKRRLSNNPSIDRINNEKVMTKDNIWIICSMCNMMKSSKTLGEFIQYCKGVAKKDFSKIVNLIT